VPQADEGAFFCRPRRELLKAVSPSGITRHAPLMG